MGPLVLGAATMVLLVAAERPVQVEIFAQPGCPFARRFITRVLNQTLTAPGMPALMELSFSPVGRSVFETSKCGASPGCFLLECGRQRKQSQDFCFAGNMVCENGEKECQAIRSLACAKRIADSPLEFMRVVDCVARQYHLHDDDGGANECASYFHIGKQKAQSMKPPLFGGESVSACVATDGHDAVAEEMKDTPVHRESPYILVDGKPLEDQRALLRTVCEAYRAGLKRADRTDPDQEFEFPEACSGDESVPGYSTLNRQLRGNQASLLATEGAPAQVETTTLVLR